jgi:ABC-type lipoprotein release transport system permease subunit
LSLVKQIYKSCIGQNIIIIKKLFLYILERYSLIFKDFIGRMLGMEWLPLVYQILEVCIIPLLGILTAYIVKYINAKSAEL